MASIGLDHPSDITWQRVCASDDMIDVVVCDSDAPAKWHSSLALFSYTPDDEYQVYEGREIEYLKVAATLTGYQPERDEIEGELDLDEFETEIEHEFEEMLDTYRKCTGGLLQVTVGPSDDEEWDKEEYPYIMDYQPKRRAMYTMVTDTDRRMSRSMEQMQIRKAAGSTESNEVLDVDLGGSYSVSGGVSVDGSGVHGSYSQADHQRVGSKQMDKQTENRVQTSSRSQEQREGYSHTTQLTQLHHLLDSYHKGTNRVLFFFLPRPYVKEEPTGFVRGPRGIDGVQEIFLVVNKPEEMDDLKTSARLDTGHYGETQKYDYDRTTAVVSGHEIDLAPPSEEDPEAVKYGEREVQKETDLFGVHTGKWIYDCYKLEEKRTKKWRPKDNDYSGYKIDTSKGNGGYEIIGDVDKSGDAFYDVSVDSSGEFLLIETEARSRACHFREATGVSGPARGSDTIGQQSSYISINVRVYLKSTEKTVPAGTEKELLITTRGLCCGPDDDEYRFPDNVPVETVPVGDHLRRVRERFEVPDFSFGEEDGDDESETSDGSDSDVTTGIDTDGSDTKTTRTRSKRTDSGKMTIHEANELGTEITREVLGKRASNRRKWTPRSTLETDHTVRTLENIVRKSESGRGRLDQSAESVDSVLTDVLARKLDTPLEEISRRSILDADTAELQRLTGLDRATINRGKAAVLGVPLKDTRGIAVRKDSASDDDDPNMSISVDIEADLDEDDDPEVDVEAEADFDGDDEAHGNEDDDSDE